MQDTLFTLPAIEFVGGETQRLTFNVYSAGGTSPFELSDCTCDFSVVSFTNRSGDPVITKSMSANGNILSVKLDSGDTIALSGKYIYQIQIRDQSGNVEIPNQGIIYIADNINKDFNAPG